MTAIDAMGLDVLMGIEQLNLTHVNRKTKKNTWGQSLRNSS